VENKACHVTYASDDAKIQLHARWKNASQQAARLRFDPVLPRRAHHQAETTTSLGEGVRGREGRSGIFSLWFVEVLFRSPNSQITCRHSACEMLWHATTSVAAAASMHISTTAMAIDAHPIAAGRPAAGRAV
jgi:hypothetical protein